LDLETKIAVELSTAMELVQEAGMEQERRSLRVAVHDLDWTREGSSAEVANPTLTSSSRPPMPSVGGNAVVFRFRLGRGSFATTVVREIFDVAGTGEEDGDG